MTRGRKSTRRRKSTPAASKSSSSDTSRRPPASATSSAAASDAGALAVCPEFADDRKWTVGHEWNEGRQKLRTVEVFEANIGGKPVRGRTVRVTVN